MALSYGCTGPMLRGSLDRTKGDPDWDLRKTEPYCGYEQYAVRRAAAAVRQRARRARSSATAGTASTCACCEVVESIKIVEQAIEKYDALHAEGEKVKAELARGSRRCDPKAKKRRPPSSRS